MRNICFYFAFIFFLNIFPTQILGGEWLEGLATKIKWENGDKSEKEYNPKKGSDFSITTAFGNKHGDVTYCTVEEVVLNKDLHFSMPTDPNEPDVTSLQDGRVKLNKATSKECKVDIKSTNSSDDGTWHFKVGYGRNIEKKWYQHRAIVRVKVDCKWGEWEIGGIRQCSKGCKGKRHDKREQVQGAMYGGKKCTGTHERIQECDGCSGANTVYKAVVTTLIGCLMMTLLVSV